MVSNPTLHRDVLAELEWDASIDPSKIGVAVENGVVTLTGTVPSYSQQVEAERAVKSVAGVKAVANDIKVHLPGSLERNDTEIAHAALNALKWHSTVPANRVQVTVKDGFVYLDGDLDWQYQRQAAGEAVRHLTGVKGVINQITLTPRVKVAEVSEKIEAAFKRSAEVDARHVKIAAVDGKVILSGKVSSWTERAAAERAAWSAPGVSSVENRLTVGP